VADWARADTASLFSVNHRAEGAARPAARPVTDRLAATESLDGPFKLAAGERRILFRSPTPPLGANDLRSPVNRPPTSNVPARSPNFLDLKPPFCRSEVRQSSASKQITQPPASERAFRRICRSCGALQSFRARTPVSPHIDPTPSACIMERVFRPGAGRNVASELKDR
jgi:hypothetical protein